MDNGQRANNSRDPFAESITAGIGILPEAANLPTSDNVNTGNFENDHSNNLAGRGNITLNTMSVQPSEFNPVMPPSEQNVPPLGQVINLMNSSQTVSTTGINPKSQNYRENIAIDPTIAQHLADNKVNGDDVHYLEGETEKFISDDNPVELVEFIKGARRTITNRLQGDHK